MKAIVNASAGTVEWQEVPMPEPGPGQVRIRTAFCGICGTDLEMIAGWKRTGFPSIPGHEWSGNVHAVGRGVDRMLVGNPCVAENVLKDGGEVGFEHPGGYGEYFVTEAAKVFRLPEKYSLSKAALIEPLAVSLRGIKRLSIRGKENALIFGDGIIGLMMLLLLKREQVKNVYLVGGRETRLSLAARMGANGTLNYHAIEKNGLAEAIAEKFPGPFSHIIEASGSSLAAHAALNLGACNCKILVIGDYGEKRTDFPWNIILHKELRIIGTNTGAGAWKQAVELACREEMDLGPLITHTFPAERFGEGLKAAKDPSQGAIKVVLRWGHASC